MKSMNDDNILRDTDVRYWMLANEEVQDMETSVLEHPHDVRLWLKLAYKKLHDNQRYVE